MRKVAKKKEKECMGVEGGKGEAHVCDGVES